MSEDTKKGYEKPVLNGLSDKNLDRTARAIRGSGLELVTYGRE